MNDLQIQIASHQAYAELGRVCDQLKAAMEKCPELVSLLKNSVFDESFSVRSGLISFKVKEADGALCVRVVISERLREIADAATRLADWDPCSPSGLQKSEVLRLVTGLTVPTADAGVEREISRLIQRAGRYS